MLPCNLVGILTAILLFETRAPELRFSEIVLASFSFRLLVKVEFFILFLTSSLL